jgi:hypothetical protein
MHGKINEKGKGKERRKTYIEKMKIILIIRPYR